MPAAEQACAPRHALDETLDRRGRAAGRVGFQPFSQQHDEHRFSGCQILTDRQRRDDRDADREVRGDNALEESRDGVPEDPVAAKDGEDRGSVNPEDSGENTEEIQQQQDAHDSGEAEVANSLSTLRVHACY